MKRQAVRALPRSAAVRSAARFIGGILGGAKGAAIGGTVGAGAGSAAVLAGGRNAATLSSGSPVTVRLEEPVSVTVER